MPLALALAALAALVLLGVLRDAGASVAAPLDFSLTDAPRPAPDFAASDASIDALLRDSLGGGAALFGQLGDAVVRAAAAVWSPPAAAGPYLDQIAQAERANGIPPNLLARVLYQESRFRPDIITGATRSGVGAAGIAQFMPATAREMGIDPLDPAQAIDGAARYLARLFNRFGNWSEALAAYNWGQGNVARKGMARAPAETRAYVADITRDVPAAA